MILGLDRRAVLLALASFVAWTVFECVRPSHPFHDLNDGHFTDHFSHMNAARVFPRLGLDVWRKPMSQNLPFLTPQELQVMPPRLRYPQSFRVPGWPADKPYQQSWTYVPRLYPPGDMLVVAPVALAYHFTPLKTEGANLLLIVEFLLLAHAVLALVLDAAFRRDPLAAPLGLLALLVTYFELTHWAASGFYDCAMLIPLILCARYLKERRGLAALVAYCVAALVHFRAYFLGVWALWAAWLLVRERGWRSFRARDWAALGVAAACSVASLGSFALVYPAMMRMNEALNPLRDWRLLLPALVLWALCGALLLRARAWFDLVTLGWVAFCMAVQHQSYLWYGLPFLAWLAAPRGADGDPWAVPGARHVADARLVATLVAMGFAFSATPFPPEWVPHVLLK